METNLLFPSDVLQANVEVRVSYRKETRQEYDTPFGPTPDRVFITNVKILEVHEETGRLVESYPAGFSAEVDAELDRQLLVYS